MSTDASDAQFNHTLASLRTCVIEGSIKNTTDISPALSLRADPALQIGGRFRSPSGRLLELNVTSSGHGEWIGLHLALGQCSLSEQAFIAIICRSASPLTQMVRPCLRSGTTHKGQPSFVDCFFDKHILSGADPTTYADALHVPSRPDLPEHAPWRELVLFLPTTGFRWNLHDLRLTVL